MESDTLPSITVKITVHITYNMKHNNHRNNAFFSAGQCINTYEGDIKCTAQQRLVNIMQKTLTNTVQW